MLNNYKPYKVSSNIRKTLKFVIDFYYIVFYILFCIYEKINL